MDVISERERLRDLLGEVLAKTTHYRGYLGDELDFLADLGLDSMNLGRLVMELEERLDLFLQDLPEGPPRTIGELLDAILSLREQPQ